MRDARVWHALLGVEKTVVEDVEFDELDQVLVVRVRPARSAAARCGVCRRRCGRYDTGEGRRRWRALDLGTVQAVLEADAPRVSCREHGVVVANVPWARHQRCNFPSVGKYLTPTPLPVSASLDGRGNLRERGDAQ